MDVVPCSRTLENGENFCEVSFRFRILRRPALCKLRNCSLHFSRAPRPAARARRDIIHQALLTSGETDNDEQNPLRPERKMGARTGWVGRTAWLPTHLHKFEGIRWARHLSNQKHLNLL